METSYVTVGETIVPVPKPQNHFEELVINYYPLALTIANRYRTDKQYIPDIRAAAIEGLADAAKRISDSPLNLDGRAPDATFIGAYVNASILECLRLKALIPIKATVFKQRLAAGLNYLIPITYEVSEDLPGGNGKYHDTMNDCLADLHLTGIQQTVLDNRLEGLTVREIGDKIGLSSSYVGQVLEQLQHRFKKVFGRS